MSKQLDQLIQSHNIILFDGVCVLCSAWANFMIKHDLRYQFKLVSVQSDLGQQILKKYHFPTDDFETMLSLEKGQLFTESTAFLRVMESLDFPYNTLRYGKFVPKFVRDFTYRRIALNRYQLFGKTEDCYVIQASDKQHFLLDDVLR